MVSAKAGYKAENRISWLGSVLCGSDQDCKHI